MPVNLAGDGAWAELGNDLVMVGICFVGLKDDLDMETFED